MNNFFNIKRFGLLLKKDFMENGSRYLLYFAALFGIMAVIMIYIAYDAYNYTLWKNELSNTALNDDLLQMASFSFLIGGLLFASTAMDSMKSKTKRISFLIVPASNFEKYFFRWLIVTIGYVIAFFLALWLADLLRMAVCSMRFPSLEIKALDWRELIKSEKNYDSPYLFYNKSIFLLCVSLFLLFQSIFVLGTLFWEKLSFVKTFAASALLIVGFFLICRWSILLFYNNEFNQFWNVLNSFELDERLTQNQAISIVIVVLLVFTIVNWTISYFRFKESEIIKRW